nr:DUF3310 domain-containing protein [uncultured Roseateles sp.]
MPPLIRLSEAEHKRLLAAEHLLYSLGYGYDGKEWCGPRPAPSALAKQEGGEHYKQMPLQPWEIIERNKLDFWEGNVIKYTLRYKSKDGAGDLRKAVHYLEYLIERETR